AGLEELCGPEHPDTLSCLSNLGYAHESAGDHPAQDPADIRGGQPRFVPDEDPTGDRVRLSLGDPGDATQRRREDFGRPRPSEDQLDVPALAARNDRARAHVRIHGAESGCGTQQRWHVYDHLFAEVANDPPSGMTEHRDGAEF
ncbi:tetratricopeptide repeat protein, partial [Kitasatospora sp. NPDC001225]